MNNYCIYYTVYNEDNAVLKYFCLADCKETAIYNFLDTHDNENYYYLDIKELIK